MVLLPQTGELTMTNGKIVLNNFDFNQFQKGAIDKLKSGQSLFHVKDICHYVEKTFEITYCIRGMT